MLDKYNSLEFKKFLVSKLPLMEYSRYIILSENNIKSLKVEKLTNNIFYDYSLESDYNKNYAHYSYTSYDMNELYTEFKYKILRKKKLRKINSNEQ